MGGRVGVVCNLDAARSRSPRAAATSSPVDGKSRRSPNAENWEVGSGFLDRPKRALSNERLLPVENLQTSGFEGRVRPSKIPRKRAPAPLLLWRMPISEC